MNKLGWTVVLLLILAWGLRRAWHLRPQGRTSKHTFEDLRTLAQIAVAPVALVVLLVGILPEYLGPRTPSTNPTPVDSYSRMPNWPPANPTEAPPFRGVPIPWPPQIQYEADQIAA